jgi:hypothetical protein
MRKGWNYGPRRGWGLAVLVLIAILIIIAWAWVLKYGGPGRLAREPHAENTIASPHLASNSGDNAGELRRQPVLQRNERLRQTRSIAASLAFPAACHLRAAAATITRL